MSEGLSPERGVYGRRRRRREVCERGALAPKEACKGAAGARERFETARLGSFNGMYAGPIQRLVTELARLPGIGQRTAQRLAFHILRADDEEAFGLAEAIREVKERVGLCEVCFNLAEGPRCRICEDERRDRSLICVVEEPADLLAVERAHEFKGRYHVLMGALSPLQGVGPDDLKIKGLLERIGDGVSEIILATNPTVEGEATAIYLARLLKPLGVKVTRIAMGVPVGSDLEYADEVTMHKAMEGRREV